LHPPFNRPKQVDVGGVLLDHHGRALHSGAVHEEIHTIAQKPVGFGQGNGKLRLSLSRHEVFRICDDILKNSVEKFRNSRDSRVFRAKLREPGLDEEPHRLLGQFLLLGLPRLLEFPKPLEGLAHELLKLALLP
jgi:hypothetical protein